MDKELISSLASCRLFQSVPAERLGVLLDSVGVRTEHWDKGNLVRQQGCRYNNLIIVTRGGLEAGLTDVTGRSLTVEHFGAPSAVATAVLVSSEPVLPVSLTATGSTTLVTIEFTKVLDLFSREPAILRAYLADAGDKVRFLAEKLRLIRFGTLRRRIAVHLLSLSREQGTDSPSWRYGRDQTADLLGAARPSLSRELAQMSREGYLEIVGRTGTRLSVERLRSFLEDD